ncbi:MAG: hypothetical protein LBM56_04160, partial [Burkholderiaceae bacterium]|nr:hypothetical protein [Burkholderiaceae bacterium]
MLSSTYVQVAMQLENDRLREDLALLKSQAGDLCARTGSPKELAEKLLRLACRLRSQCCSRRIETAFLPGMRQKLPESASLMVDRDALHQSATHQHGAICLCLYRSVKEGIDIRAKLGTYIERYCQTILLMLNGEEDELLPLAREKFSREDWFSFAGAFMREKTNEAIIEWNERDVAAYCARLINEADSKADHIPDRTAPARQMLESISLRFRNGQLPAVA